MISLKGKNALITGASKGIGREIALALAEQGVNLALNSSSLQNLESLNAELAAKNINLVLCPGDLSNPDTPEAIMGKAIDGLGGLDILINNAGIANPAKIEATTADLWDKHMAVNARAPFLLSREALPYLRTSDAGAIVNIASVVATKGYVNQGAYAASKHALLGFTKVLAQEVFNDGIRVHVISPGGVATEMVTRMRPDIDTSELMSPKEIAEIVMFLLTHRGNAMIDEINVRRASNSPWK